MEVMRKVVPQYDARMNIFISSLIFSPFK